VSGQIRRTAIFAVCIALGGAPASHAQQPGGIQDGYGPMSAPVDTLRLAASVAAARAANPAVQAARLKAEADRERISPAGALPDPVLELGLLNRPLDDFGTDERMTMNLVGLKQSFPWPGNQGFSKQAGEHLARAAELDATDVEAQIVARTRAVHARLGYLDRAIAITADTRQLLRDFLEVAEAKYASGAGIQQDLLQAQVAVGRTTADLVALEQERVAATARLNALMGRPAEESVRAVDMPTPGGELPRLDSLAALARYGRPAVAAAHERARAAEASYRAAGRAGYPDFELRLAWGQRPQYSDMGSIALGVSLPVWGGSKDAPLERAAAARQAESEARALELYYETYARLGELRAADERARTLDEIYRVQILPQAEAAVESALGAYQVGAVDYATLLEARLTVNRFLVDSVRLTAERLQARAEIEALVGVPPTDLLGAPETDGMTHEMDTGGDR
jgi:cobalt-zinc-cadmium efflux system outer membrane protein